MTGSNQFSTADDQFKRFIDATDSYINNSGLDLVKYNKDVETILNLTPFELRSLNSEECGEKAYAVFAYASYVQTEYNRNLEKLNWSNDALWRILASEMKQYGDRYTKWEEKYHQALRGNDFASSLHTIKLHAQARFNRLQDKIKDIRRMGDILVELQRSKRQNR